MVMIRIFVDADACPVKNEIYKIAERHHLKTVVVSNSWMRIPQSELIEFKVVNDSFDAADNWIADHILEHEIAVTADIPLASRCLEKGARVIDPKGKLFTKESIGDALANRELMAYLRDMGNVTGGPAPFSPQDRSRFMQQLDIQIQSALRSRK